MLAPTHVSFAYLINEVIMLEYQIPINNVDTPDNIEHIVCMWHWQTEDNVPYNPEGGPTDYLPGISFWRNSDALLHRVGGPAIHITRKPDTLHYELICDLLNTSLHEVPDTYLLDPVCDWYVYCGTRIFTGDTMSITEEAYLTNLI